MKCTEKISTGNCNFILQSRTVLSHFLCVKKSIRNVGKKCDNLNVLYKAMHIKTS